MNRLPSILSFLLARIIHRVPKRRVAKSALARLYARGPRRHSRALFGLVVICCSCSPIAPDPESPETATTFDVVITGGRVVDGTGTPWFRADIGLREGRISAIGRLADAEAGTKIDASGLVVAPGFIDMLGQSEFNILVDGRAASKTTQGITTEITGEGSSIGPVNERMMEAQRERYEHFNITQDFRTLGEYFERLETASRSAVNIASFVGAGGGCGIMSSVARTGRLPQPNSKR